MELNIIARAEIDINAPRSKVWEALVDPDAIREYMFGAKVETDWKPGSTITWTGVWKGTPYKDKGEVLEVKENRLLQYTHFSPLSKDEDKPENYHVITVLLFGDGERCHLVVSQNKNRSVYEKEHFSERWRSMLESMKEVVENKMVSA